MHEFGKIEITIQKADSNMNLGGEINKQQAPSSNQSSEEEIKQSDQTEIDFKEQSENLSPGNENLQPKQ